LDTHLLHLAWGPVQVVNPWVIEGDMELEEDMEEVDLVVPLEEQMAYNLQ